MEIVAGLTLKSLTPRIWDAESEYFLPALKAVMISYADFHRMPRQRQLAMEQGLHKHFGIPRKTKIYLDNGAFYFIARKGETPRKEYEEFVAQAKPDWWPIPQDFIPTPQMSQKAQRQCYERTMQVNRDYQHDGFVPVVHVGQHLEKYFQDIQTNERLLAKPTIALGGIVPNLLRSPKALPYAQIINNIRRIREVFSDKQIHVFGIGGTSTLHIAALLKMDSVDSSGWRNRAARGIVQLPGSGDRMVADLGSWRGRKPSKEEWDILAACPCPACKTYGLKGLKAKLVHGFRNRATHNLWVLLEENRLIKKHIANGKYERWYKQHLDNTIYLPLIEQTLSMNDL